MMIAVSTTERNHHSRARQNVAQRTTWTHPASTELRIPTALGGIIHSACWLLARGGLNCIIPVCMKQVVQTNAPLHHAQPFPLRNSKMCLQLPYTGLPIRSC